MDHCPKIIVRFISPENQRYPTCGDWLYDAESHTLEIRVSKMDDWRSELAVAIHEAVEAVFCTAVDITEAEVTEFDMQFNRGDHPDDMEPGDDIKAPYRVQHIAATFVEQEVCDRLALPWTEHEKNVLEA